MRPLWAVVLVMGVLGAFCAPAPGQADSVVAARIIDGDTFESGDGQKIQIIGIDAPENDPISTDHLRRLIEDKKVTLQHEGAKEDKYGRRLAYVHLADTIDVGAQMVRDGYALAYLKYPCARTDQYLQLEVEARKAGRGIWAGHFRSTLSEPTVGTRGDTQKAAEGITVYVTRTGGKYHRVDCRHLSKSRIPLDLEDAKSRYGPCKVCKPPQ